MITAKDIDTNNPKLFVSQILHDIETEIYAHKNSKQISILFPSIMIPPKGKILSEGGIFDKVVLELLKNNYSVIIQNGDLCDIKCINDMFHQFILKNEKIVVNQTTEISTCIVFINWTEPDDILLIDDREDHIAMDAGSLLKIAISNIKDDFSGIASYCNNDISIIVEIMEDNVAPIIDDTIIDSVSIRTIAPLESNNNEVIQYILDNDFTKNSDKDAIAHKLGYYSYFLSEISVDQFMKIWEALFTKKEVKNDHCCRSSQ